ncbi:MAG: cohesin domain-containing protein [Candidatus Uhrbacteria bacterium]|nr:cohesin domain-containing protein [Candidatus Uhrbacteria bacterium]
MNRFSISVFVAAAAFFCVSPPVFAAGQATIFLSPPAQEVIEGSTFNVSIYIDTHKTSINTMELGISFPPNLLQMMSPSGGKSLIQIWLEPPSYSNTVGSARFVGIIPNGITTQSGLITTISFKALKSGQATIGIAPSSKILANDGLGTQMKTEFGRAVYTITPQPPAGVRVFSDTHPFESHWYSNKNAVIGWDQDRDVTDFSFLLDDKPSTIPDDVPDLRMTSILYVNLGEGLRYFHIKARKQNVWGATTHFLLRIDSLPPAGFEPHIEVLNDRVFHRALVTFFTTDSLSGMDHYEVAVIDKTESPNISPIFVQAESPFQLPDLPNHALRIIVRAVDGAGNVRDASLDVDVSASLTPFAKTISFVQHNLISFLAFALLLILFFVLLHYLIGHHIYRRMKEVLHLLHHADEVHRIEQEWHDEDANSKP